MHKVGFLSLSSNLVCENQQMVAWNRDISDKTHSNHFFVKSSNHQTITVLKKGIYQVQVRLAGSNNGNTQSLALMVNGTDVAQCFQSDARGHQNTAQIFEIISLKAKDELQVRCGYNRNSLGSDNGNRFTIFYLGV